MPTFDETVSETMGQAAGLGNQIEALDTITQTVGLAAALTNKVNVLDLISQGLGIEASPATTVIVNDTVAAGLGNAAALGSSVTVLERLAADFGFDDVPEFLVYSSLAEQMAFADTSVGVRVALAELIEEFRLVAPATSIATLTNLLAEVMVINDLAQAGFQVEAVEQVQFNAAVQDKLTALNQLVATLGLDDAMTVSRWATLEVTEEIGAQAGLTSTAVVTTTLLEQLLLNGVLIINGVPFHAWVVNTEGKMPISHYPDYPFTSMARIGNRYLGVNDTGLYALDGANDAGDPIVAAVTTGQLHFGSSMLKNVYDVFIGRTTTGRLVLKVRSTDEGQYKEYWYELRRNTAGTHSDERVKLGRGVRSIYWQFELVNPDGDDFEIDYLTPDAIKMSRRT